MKLFFRYCWILFFFLFFFILADCSYARDRMFLAKGIEILLQNWKPLKALQFAEELKKLDKDDSTYFFYKAKINFYLGNYQEADNYIKDVIKRDKGWQENEEINKLKELIQSTVMATEGFFTEKRGHFIIRFKEGKDRVLLNRAFYALEKSYEEIGEDLGYYPEKEVIVEIYPSVDTFTGASGIPKEAVETSGTCALCNYNRIFITSPRATLRGYRWLDTLCHEYVHYAIYKKVGPNTPLWMHEGLAKFLERRWRQKTGRMLDPFSENTLAMRLRADKLVTFEEMIPSFAFLKTSHDVMLAFAQVMTIIEYFEKKGGRKSLSLILDKLSKKQPVEIAIQEVFGIDLKNILVEWKDYIKRKNLKIWPNIDHEELIFKDPDKDEDENDIDLKHISSKKVKKFITLGDMLKNRKRPKAAAIEYFKAKNESDILMSALENKIAMTYFLSNQIKKAEDILLKAEITFPDFVTSYVNLGRLYLENENFQNAEIQLEEARDINPFNPWIYEGLIKIYKKTKQMEKVNAAQYALEILLRD